MTAQPNDGGPAFPTWEDVPIHGMSLRDWFAGQVISPALVQAYGNNPPVLAEYAYKLADAMLAARATNHDAEPLTPHNPAP